MNVSVQFVLVHNKFLQETSVRLGVDVLPDINLANDIETYGDDTIGSHHDLESVETAGFRGLDFGTKLLDKIFRYNSVRRRKKRQNDRE